ALRPSGTGYGSAGERCPCAAAPDLAEICCQSGAPARWRPSPKSSVPESAGPDQPDPVPGVRIPLAVGAHLAADQRQCADDSTDPAFSLSSPASDSLGGRLATFATRLFPVPCPYEIVSE